MDPLDILLYASVLLPFALLLVWQIKSPWLSREKSIRRLEKRIGLPVTILNRPTTSSKKIQGKLPDRLKQVILQAGIREEKVNTTLVCGLTLAAIHLFLMLLPVKFGPAALIAVILLPFIVPLFIIINIVRRRRLLLRQLPDAVEAIIRAVSAGSSINQAIMTISNDFPDPISGEFRQIRKQIELGLPFKDVLNGFRRRLNIAEVHYLALALVVHRETGGHLINILEQLVGVMRRRMAFRIKLRTLTAEPRFTAFFLGCLPFVFLSVRYFIDPQIIDFFLHDPSGFFLLKICLASIIAGAILIKYLSRINP